MDCNSVVMQTEFYEMGMEWYNCYYYLRGNLNMLVF